MNSLVVVLRPLVERVLVALGALDADSQKRVGEAECLLLRLRDGPPRPEMGQSRTVGVFVLGMVALRVLAVQIGHFLGVVGVGLIRRPAGRQHDAFHDLVVGHVGPHALQQPVVPFLAGPLIDGRRCSPAPGRCCR